MILTNLVFLAEIMIAKEKLDKRSVLHNPILYISHNGGNWGLFIRVIAHERLFLPIFAFCSNHD